MITTLPESQCIQGLRFFGRRCCSTRTSKFWPRASLPRFTERRAVEDGEFVFWFVASVVVAIANVSLTLIFVATIIDIFVFYY